MKTSKPIRFWLSPLPESDEQALEWLQPLLDLGERAIRRVPAGDFKRGWYAVAFLYTGLHPDSALDHGKSITHDYDGFSSVRPADSQLLSPYYERSGWPVLLAPVAKEAWRRFHKEELKDEEFYCSEAQMAGISSRNQGLADEVREARDRCEHDRA